ncbi:MAG: inorganic phosphate transporter, partial [Candidatus Omnitrophica bacterium]|nr:inorganic phosphate transporter [Candidatus Omnitrophota bacterium]
AGAGILSPKIGIILGGAAIVIGILTWGYKVIETIGSEIIHLTPIMAFSAQLASALNVHMYTLMGIPVSTSHSIVGAICGVGLVKGIRVLNIHIMRDIVLCWVATPFISGLISFVILKGIIFFK